MVEWRSWVGCACAGLIAACGDAGAPPPARSGTFHEGILAMVGDDAIHAETVRRVMKVQGLAASAALDRAVRDALFAREARQRYEREHLLPVLERAVLARRLLEALQAEARARGPSTTEEVAQVLERSWYDIDRPSAARTIHAAVLVKSEAQMGPARALAGRILGAVQDAKTAQEFEHAARSVEAGTLEVRVETLPPVARDGRIVPDEPPLPGATVGELEEPFARAAHDIERVGGSSGVVETSYGFHVIRLLARTEAWRLPEAERKQRVDAEVISDRARALEQSLVEALTRQTAVRVERDAADLTSRVVVAP